MGLEKLKKEFEEEYNSYREKITIYFYEKMVTLCKKYKLRFSPVYGDLLIEKKCVLF